VLKLQAVVIDVLVSCFGGPYPSLAWRSNDLPAVFQHGADSWGQRQYAPRSLSFAFCDQKHSIPAVAPVNVFPSEAVAFLWAHPSVEQHNGNLMQEWQGSHKVKSFLLGRYDSFPPMFTTQEFDSG
jgi:hypothetical protein